MTCATDFCRATIDFKGHLLPLSCPVFSSYPRRMQEDSKPIITGTMRDQAVGSPLLHSRQSVLPGSEKHWQAKCGTYVLMILPSAMPH